jgi:heat shock protein HslJ
LDWDLVQMAGRAPLAGSQMTLVLTQEGLSGIAACNHYFGSYQLDGQTLTVGVLGRTEMYCDGRMEQEDAYLALLAAAQTLTVESGRLVIGTPEEDLVYELAENAKLEGAEWTLDGLAQGDAIVQTWLDPEITALFEDGRVSGSAGCNRYFANYTLDGGAITVGAVGSTRMMCDDERMERERGFLDALARAAQWRIRRQSLTLYDADGNVLMMLTTAAG